MDEGWEGQQSPQGLEVAQDEALGQELLLRSHPEAPSEADSQPPVGTSPALGRVPIPGALSQLQQLPHSLDCPLGGGCTQAVEHEGLGAVSWECWGSVGCGTR